MTCLIVDDDLSDRTQMRQMATSIPFLEVVGECASSDETSNFFKTQSVDLLLLDIEMPCLRGFDLIKSLPARLLVILVADKPDYAVGAFEVQVVDYLLKPVTLPRFVTALQRAKTVFENHNEKKRGCGEENIFVRSNNTLLKIKFEDLLWVEALGDYVTFQMADKKHVVYATLRQVEEKLPQGQFLRIHRKYIVSLKKIEKIEEGRVIVQQLPLPVGETFKASLLNWLNLL